MTQVENKVIEKAFDEWADQCCRTASPAQRAMLRVAFFSGVAVMAGELVKGMALDDGEFLALFGGLQAEVQEFIGALLPGQG